MQGVENELTTKETRGPWQWWRTPKCPILREEHPIASLSVEAREGKAFWHGWHSGILHIVSSAYRITIWSIYCPFSACFALKKDCDPD
jgi:hypothetical protein